MVGDHGSTIRSANIDPNGIDLTAVVERQVESVVFHGEIDIPWVIDMADPGEKIDPPVLPAQGDPVVARRLLQEAGADFP
ncbi:MAG: hypothetical protein CL812_12610 [Confluentimicrobium sp.]|nr:hypothetical protein [Actibacterium sp.]